MMIAVFDETVKRASEGPVIVFAEREESRIANQLEILFKETQGFYRVLSDEDAVTVR